MKKVSSYLYGLLLLTLLTFGCTPGYEVITNDRFEDLIKNNLVQRVIIITNDQSVEVYLDQQKIAQSSFTDTFELDAVLSLTNIKEDDFVDWYDQLVRENNLRYAPNLEFDSRPDFMDFLTGYGFLFLLLIGLVFLFILFPVYIVSQKRKIRALEARVSLLEHKEKSLDKN